MRIAMLAGVMVFATAAAGAGEPVLMSADWAAAACEAWNADPVLTGDLVSSGWVKNDKGRGYKAMRVYREDCGKTATAELRVSLTDGEARCTYGGAIGPEALDSGADYLMHATTRRWLEMGAGEYGPMKAMMLGRLSFSGPYGEAMGNMGPFTNFLRLVGKVPSDSKTCPN
jgi:putative sterol carrier protein